MTEVEQLEKEIRYYSEKYYCGEQEISDEQFDLLVDKLKELNSNSDLLKTGWGFEVQGEKIKHKYTHIGSLDKCKKFSDFPDRFIGKVIYLSPKLDGLSAVAYYRQGKLIRGVTRGNGEYGKDITDKLKIILGDEIGDKNFTGGVRGELIIHENNWKELQGKYNDLIAPRNFAAGIINRKDIDEDINCIDMVVYKIVGQENKPVWTNRKDIIGWLSNNFKHCIPLYYFPVLNEPSWEQYRDEVFENFKKLGYGLDGLVLTRETAQYDENTNGLLYDEVAYKFLAESTNTTIKSINWELSRTQRMIPVGNVEPVELSGAVVQNVTFNNAKWIKDFGLGKGAEISIMRSNEVIPCLLEVISSVEPDEKDLPVNCPVCGSKLEWVGVDLKCVNKYCKNIEASDLQQWCEVIGETDNFAWLLMKQYLDKFGITNLEELYRVKNSVLEWFEIEDLSITDKKAYEFFKKLYLDKVSVEKALLALNIPRLGDKTVQILASEQELILRFFGLCVKDNRYSYDVDFVEIQNKLYELVKEATTRSLLENKDKFINLGFLIYDNRLVFSDRQQKGEIKYIAVTGSLQTMKRKDFEEYIKQYGYELSGNLKKCKYLITNDPNSGSTKNREAQKYNIPIITEQQFFELYK